MSPMFPAIPCNYYFMKVSALSSGYIELVLHSPGSSRRTGTVLPGEY